MRFNLQILLLCSAFIPHPSSLIPSAAGQTAATIAERPEFRRLVAEDAVVEKLAGGFQFLEGPAWNPAEGCLMFSDIPANRIYRYDPATKSAAVWREPSGAANGNFYDAKGDFYSCEQDPHRVSVTRRDGTVDHLPDGWEGWAFSSPNDVVVKSDGTVWFTDPTYGLGKRKKEQATNNVYCYDPKKKEMRAAVTGGGDQPNGLCFSPDEKRLYVSDTGGPRNVRVFEVGADNRLGAGRVFCVLDNGAPDGIRCDAEGNLWSSAGDGVQVFNAAGERLGRILVGETPANLCFGGVDGQGRRELYVTARTGLYRVGVVAEVK